MRVPIVWRIGGVLAAVAALSLALTSAVNAQQGQVIRVPMDVTENR